MECNTSPVSDVALSPESITEQLDRILVSETFTDAPSLQQLLGYVVNETLHGRSSHIKGISIAHDVFHRESQGDAQDMSIVRVEAGRLRHRLEDYYLKEGRQDPIRIRIPNGGYVPVFEGIATASEAIAVDGPAFEPPRSPRPRPTRTRILAIVAILLTLFALFRVFVLFNKENLPAGNNAQTGKPAIAVLPFVDASGNTR